MRATFISKTNDSLKQLAARNLRRDLRPKPDAAPLGALAVARGEGRARRILRQGLAK